MTAQEPAALDIFMDGAADIDDLTAHHRKIDSDRDAPAMKGRIFRLRQKRPAIDDFVHLIVDDDEIGIEAGGDGALAVV
jgi:hypothetical protein